jgi:RNA polymerase sigma-70 factor (ECF subfamily)
MTSAAAQNEPISDETLAERVIKGDKDAFGGLIDRYEEKLTRYVKRFTQEKDDIDDLVQVIFIKAYTHLNAFDTTRSFNSWVYRIAHNESVNHLKRKGNQKISFIDFDTMLPHPFAKETSDDIAFKKEIQAMLEPHLAKLSPKYREVLILYYYDDLSYQEIGDVLSIPTSTVGIRIRRGKEFLKKNLGENITLQDYSTQ